MPGGPVSADAVTLLAMVPRASLVVPTTVSNDSVFALLLTTCDAKTPWTFSKRDLVKTAERAGIDRSVTLSSLRHTFGSSHAAAGTPVKIVSVMMGHSNIAQTADTMRLQESPDPSTTGPAGVLGRLRWPPVVMPTGSALPDRRS